MKRHAIWATLALVPPILGFVFIEYPWLIGQFGFLTAIWERYRVLFILLPVLIFGLNLIVNGLFQASRLSYMNLFLGLSYLYIVIPWLGIGLGPQQGFAEVYRNSFAYLVMLIPLNFLVYHFQSEHSLRSRLGLISLSCLFGQFFLLAGLYWLEDWLNLDWMNSFWDLIFTVPLPGIGQEAPWIIVALVAGSAVVFHYPSRASFYHTRNTILFWVMATAMLGFYPEFETTTATGFPIQHLLFFGIASLMSSSKTIHLVWVKTYHDPLTQIPARLALDERLSALSKRYSITMIDIDHFKDFNDTYGHGAGDKVLRMVADTLRAGSSGQVYRFGGEEFTLIYSNYLPEDIEDELENIREQVKELKVQVTKKSARATKLYNPTVSISLGVAGHQAGDGEVPEDVIDRADQALYKAKEGGRDQVVID